MSITLNGKYPLRGGSEESVIKLHKYITESMGSGSGSYLAEGYLKEALSTSDGPFNLAQVINVNFYPQFAEAPRTWKAFAGQRLSPTLDRTGIYSMVLDWEDGALGAGDPRHVAPRLAEGEAYPYATLGEVESQGGGFGRKGFKTKFTLEQRERDPLGWIAALPNAMLQVALDTEEADVYDALINGVDADQQITADTAPITGETVTANALLSREALIVALKQLKNRTWNGRKLVFRGGFDLIVPVGDGDIAQWYISGLELTGVKDANFSYSANLANPLRGINVVESEYIDEGAWYLKGKNLANGVPILEHLGWTKQAQPERRVADDAGNYITGGAVNPMQGSFVNDTIQYRMRQFSGGALYVPDAVIWSDGSES